MSTTWIGPVKTTLWNLEFETKAGGSSVGRSSSLSALLSRPQAEQVVELVSNVFRQRTYGDVVGVLVYLFNDGDLLGPHRGWYVLTDADFKTRPDTLSDRTSMPEGLVELSVGGWFMGDISARQVAVALSASARENAFGLTPSVQVVDPFWSESTLGDALLKSAGTFTTREYDPDDYDPRRVIADTRQLPVYITDLASLPDVVYPVPEFDTRTTPRWVSNRGNDVKVWDRRQERYVYGDHSFQQTTDIKVMNGLFSFWVGNRGMVPFLNTETCVNNKWVDTGVIQLSDDPTQKLLAARVTESTDEYAVVELDVTTLGTITLTLLRGERGVQVQHGSQLEDSVFRSSRWSPYPPVSEVDGVSLESAKFDGGARLSGGSLWFLWPSSQSSEEYSLDLYWIPSTGTGVTSLAHWGDDSWGAGIWGGALADTVIVALNDSSGGVGRLEYDADSSSINFVVGSQKVTVGPLTIVAGVPIFVGASFSVVDGMALTVAIGSTVTHARNSAYTDPNTSDPVLSTLGVGSAAGVDFGEGAFGEYPFGEIAGAGLFDNIQIYEDFLSDAERAALAIQTSRLGGVPVKEGSLIWMTALDIVELSGSYSDGKTENAAYDANGIKHVAVSLDAVSQNGLGVSLTGSQMEVGMYLTLDAAGQTGTEVHAQMDAARDQEVGIR